MARVSRPDQEKVEEDPTLVQPQDPAVAQSLGAAGPASAPGGRSSEAPAAPTTRRHFNDLSRLLYANQGQGAKMAQTAVAKADQGAAGVNSQLADAQSRFSTAAQAAVPKAITPAAPPPVVQGGGGGLTGRGTGTPSTPPIYRGDLPQFFRETEAYNKAPPSTPRSTTRLNTGDSLAEQEQVAGATYKGPASLAETPGVNIQDMQQGINRAGQAYSALDRNPSRQTGGIGRFNDFLIGAEGRPAINEAKKRFQGLRDRFVGAVGDTAAADQASADTKRVATEARATIDRNRAEAEAREALRQTAENQAAAAAQSEDDYFHEYRQMNPTLSEDEARRYYDSDTDHIKQIIDNNRAAAAGTGRPAPTREPAPLEAGSDADYISEYRRMNPLLSESQARAAYEANPDRIKQVIDNNRRARGG